MNNKQKRSPIWYGLIIAVIALAGGGIYFANQYFENRNFTDGTTNVPIVSEGQPGSGVALEGAGGNTAVNSAERPQLTFRLSQGEAQPDEIIQLPILTGEPLTEAEINQILERLPQLTTNEEDQVGLNLPDELIPPPRPGQTVDVPFPPPAPEVTPDEVPGGPLEVLRFSPEGELPLAPFVSVTFNQPMVPLTTVEALDAIDPPVQITPNLPGRWVWLGTQTLTFEADDTAVDRLPMATEYTVTIPAGTTSMSGGELAETVSWTFSTPPVQMIQSYPQNSSQPVEPLIFIEFDQLIEPSAVLDTIKLEANGRSQNIRLATEEEIAADEQVANLVEGASDGRFLVLRPNQPLPTDANISVTIGPNTPSAEGPRLTTNAQSFSFRTYAPLRVTDSYCGWGGDECPPLTPFVVEFNNSLDPTSYDENMIQISPELAGARVRIVGSSLRIEGVTQGRTEYRVRISGDLMDSFGQTLSNDQVVRFDVGSAPQLLSGPNEPFVTLDPSAQEPVFTFYSINFDELGLEIYDVEPSDWRGFITYQENINNRNEPTPPGSLIREETLSIDGERDELVETAVSLTNDLQSDTGHLLVIISPPDALRQEDPWRYRPLIAWVQVTQIGLDVFSDQQQMVVWATDLQTGAPLSGVSIEQQPNGNQATTNGEGVARFDLPTNGANYIVARNGDDVAMLPSNSRYWDEYIWRNQTVNDRLSWYVIDDRHIYRPGETVHLKGWIRQISNQPGGDVSLFDSANSVTYTVLGPQENELFSGQAELNALGGFDFSFDLPENTNLGYAYITMRVNAAGVDGRDYWHDFQIQEFRRPEFEVSARNETTGPYFVSDFAVVAAEASYFSGGPLADAEVFWSVNSSPSSYSPPNWPEFTFGTWTPWWFYDYGYYEEEAFFFDGGFGGESVYESFDGRTDGTGNHYLQLDFEGITNPQPYSVVAEATVMDVNRQAWAARTTLLVHPSDLYVGLRSPSTFVEQGEPLDIEAIVTDLDGNAVAGQTVEITAVRQEWGYVNGRWAEQEADRQSCTLTSESDPVLCTFETELGGTYQITAVVTDAQGRQNQSEMTRWVSGGDRPPARTVEQEQLTLIPNQPTYQPGDTAEILIMAPFSSAEGLLTVTRNGILTTEQFTMEGSSHTLQVPISEEHIPNLGIHIELVGQTERTNEAGDALTDLPPRPAYAVGQLDLSVPPHSRTLTVEAVPQQSELAPGEETAVNITVTDASGNPVSNAEVALIVVDEAVLALSNYQLRDPLNAFYNSQNTWINSVYGRNSIILANPEALRGETAVEAPAMVEVTRVVSEVVTEGEMLNMAVADGEVVEEMEEEAMADESAALAFDADDSGGDSAGEANPIQIRTNFDPLATFAPAVQTDANGNATVTVQLPDNLTRYRIMAVAVANENEFGSSESNLTARLPLMVRPSAPRFLNFGDQFELPVVVQNQTDEPMEVDVVVQTTNLNLTDGAGQRITVPANDRVEVRFPATTDSAGTVQLQIAAVSGELADAATLSLPVYTPATTEAFATYGVIDDGAIAQPVTVPDDVYAQFGGLEVSTSSTALQALTDAVLYLATYPYDHSEQAASRILAISSLRDVLTAFEAEGLPEPAQLEATVQSDIERLQGLQNFDGGFPIWERNRESVPYYSIYAAHALTVAQQKGFDVPQEMMELSRDYLRNIESHIPSSYGPDTRRSLSAYALYVRDLMGDNDPAKAAALLQEQPLDEWPLEGLAWLWPTLDGAASTTELSDDIYRHLQNRAVETANAANFTTSYGDDAYLMLHSDRRTDGLILDAMIRLRPESDLIPKVVNGLLAHRVNGRWSNTQENSFILLALDRYFNTFEAETPDFVARIWLGETYAGEHLYEGRTTERYETAVPMSYFFTEGSDELQNLILSKDGQGRLYYRLGLQYAPTDLALDPLDRGFIVTRTYEAVDDPEDVFLDEDGVWHIKAGARVRVTVTMVANNRRYHVALVDPLPAGLEIVNSSLPISQSPPPDDGSIEEQEASYDYWWRWYWYDHQNLRDERAEAFTPLLWEGVYTYSYVARATTPGSFIVPPAKAEEMYSPEVFGRSASDRVIVEDVE